MSAPDCPLLKVTNLCKTHARGPWWRRIKVRALDNVNLALQAGSTLAVVGESGSGKTTLAMCLVGLEQPDSGEIWFRGTRLSDQTDANRNAGCEIQLIFQDSSDALNPRMSASEIIEEPLLIHGQLSHKERLQQVAKVMHRVGLPSEWSNRRPCEFSGGQRQRLAIARALVLKPKLLILDEALTGLDLSIRGQIVNVLSDLQASEGLAYIYISHDLQLVSVVADEVAVVQEGRVIRQGAPKEVFAQPHAVSFPMRVAEVPKADLVLTSAGGA